MNVSAGNALWVHPIDEKQKLARVKESLAQTRLAHDRLQAIVDKQREDIEDLERLALEGSFEQFVQRVTLPKSDFVLLPLTYVRLEHGLRRGVFEFDRAWMEAFDKAQAEGDEDFHSIALPWIFFPVKLDMVRYETVAEIKEFSRYRTYDTAKLAVCVDVPVWGGVPVIRRFGNEWMVLLTTRVWEKGRSARMEVYKHYVWTFLSRQKAVDLVTRLVRQKVIAPGLFRLPAGYVEYPEEFPMDEAFWPKPVED